ncbi:restriction endonuclease subunit S [Pseudomonas putida]|uniref:restriction endonuclease subunit S n=1 Tax=Pseudomonas putida TaxID=303 RepID=UPI0037353E28
MSSEVLVGRFSIGDLIKAGAITAHKDGNFGSLYPKIDDFVDDGIPLLTAKVVNAGRINFSAAQKLCQEKAAKLPYGFIRAGDVLLSHNATVGRVAVVPEFNGQAMIGTSLTYFRVDRSRLLPRYLAYFFESRDFQNQLASVMGLSTRNQVPITAQRLLEVEVPFLAVQCQISKFVGAVDDRITLLRETNATLESIAQALFKSWFVDFDPVRAKAEGRQPEGMDATTAALFPDRFEESELGVVPKGWSIGSVGDLASQKKGSVNPLASPGVLYEHYSLPAFDSGQAPVFELGQEIKSNKTPLPGEAVLLSKLNPHIPRVWLPVSCGANAVCSTEFLAYSPRDGASKELIYCLFGSSEFQQQLCQLVTGTSNSHQRVKPDQVLAIKLPIAGKPALKAFTESVQPIFEHVHANRLQAQTLTQLRDTLLPRLISGQLRLPEAQALLNDGISEQAPIK